MIETIKNFEYLKVSNFANKLLILLIICFAFFSSFQPSVGKNIAIIMLCIWLLSLNFQNIFYYFKNNKIFLFIIVFFIWITLTVLITSTSSCANYNNFIKYFLLPILIIVTTIKKEHIKYIIGAFLFGIFINQLISYGIYFEFIRDSFLGFKITGNSSNPVPFLTSYIEYSTFLSFTIIVSLLTLTFAKNRFLKVGLSLFIIIMVINLFLTPGRTGQFTLVTTLLLILIIYYRHNIKYIILGVITLSIVFTLAFNFSSNTNQRLKKGFSDITKIIEDKDYNTSFGIRITSYILISDIIKSEKFSILYGFGYCELYNEVCDVQTNKIGEWMREQMGHLHNTYFTVFAGTGFIGIVLFLIFWYYLFALKIEDTYIHYIRYIYFFTVSFSGISSELFWQKDIMLLSAVFIPIIIYATTKNNKERISE